MKKRKSITNLKRSPSRSNSVQHSPHDVVNDNSSQAVKVGVRFRPPKEDENNRYTIDFDDEETFTIAETVRNKKKNRSFRFDRVFDPDANQKQVFNVLVKDLLAEVVNGYNATVFAYGQTGCGKTYSMFGLEGKNRFIGKTRGIIPRSAEEIFRLIDNDEEIVAANIGVSLVEIYKEQFVDLLDPDNKKTLKLREDRRGDVVLLGCTEKFVATPAQMIDIMASGEKHRTTAATEMNEVSSRSHTVCTVKLQLKLKDLSKRTSRLYLADLAGSERVNKSKLKAITLTEAKKINQSLATLGNCINALTDQKRSHVPFRDSKLTYFLKNALGGNCKTALLVAVSPDESNAGETLSSLKFAQRSSHVTNSVHVNKELSAKELQEQVKELKKQLKQSKTVIRRLSSGLNLSKDMMPLSPGREERIDIPKIEDTENQEPAKIKKRSRSRTGSRSGSRTGSRVGSRAGSRVGSRTGSRVGSRAGSRVGSRAGSRVGSRAGSRVGSRAGSRVGSRAGSRKSSPRSRKKSKSKSGSRAGSKRNSPTTNRGSIGDLASKVFALARQDSMANRRGSNYEDFDDNYDNDQEQKKDQEKKEDDKDKDIQQDDKNKKESMSEKDKEETKSTEKKVEEAKSAPALHYAQIVDGKCSNCDLVISQEWDFCASCGACVSEAANIRNEDGSIDVSDIDNKNKMMDVTTAPLQALKRIHVRRDSMTNEKKVNEQPEVKKPVRRPRSRRSSIDHLPDQPVAPAKIRSKSRDRKARRSGNASPPVTARFVADAPLTARRVNNNNLKSPAGNAEIEGVRTAPVSSDSDDSDDEMPSLVFLKPKKGAKTPRVAPEKLKVASPTNKRSSVIISEQTSPKKKIKSPKRATISDNNAINNVVKKLEPENTSDPWGTMQEQPLPKQKEKAQATENSAVLAAMALMEAGAADDDKAIDDKKNDNNKNNDDKKKEVSKNAKPWKKNIMKPKPKIKKSNEAEDIKPSNTLQQVCDESKTHTGPKPIKPSAIKKVYEKRAVDSNNKNEEKNNEENKNESKVTENNDSSLKNDDNQDDKTKKNVRRKSIDKLKRRNSTLRKKDLRADKPWLRKRKKSSSQIDIVVLTPKKPPSRKNSLNQEEIKTTDSVNVKTDDDNKVINDDKEKDIKDDTTKDSTSIKDDKKLNGSKVEKKDDKSHNKNVNKERRDSLEDDLQNAMSYEEMKAKRKQDRKNRLSKTYGSSNKLPVQSNKQDEILPDAPDSPKDDDKKKNKKEHVRRSSLQDDLENVMSYEEMRKQRKAQRKKRLSKAYSSSKLNSALKAQRSQGSLAALKRSADMDNGNDLPPSVSHSSADENLIKGGRRSDDMEPTPSTDNNDIDDNNDIIPNVIKFDLEEDDDNNKKSKKRPFWACCFPKK